MGKKKKKDYFFLAHPSTDGLLEINTDDLRDTAARGHKLRHGYGVVARWRRLDGMKDAALVSHPAAPTSDRPGYTFPHNRG